MMMTRTRNLWCFSFVFVCVTLLVILVFPGVASAHTDFESSIPADGEVTQGPVSDVVVTFTQEVSLVGDGFELVDELGVEHTPVSATSADGESYNVTFDPPVRSGSVVIRWRVESADGHVINDTFGFLVRPPVVPETTLRVAETTVAEDGAERPTTSRPVDPARVEPARVDSNDDVTAWSRRVGAVGRFLVVSGTVGVVGIAVFAFSVLKNQTDERNRFIGYVRWSALVVGSGAVLAFVARLVTRSGEWSNAFGDGNLTDALQTPFASATAMRVIGAVLVIVGVTAMARTSTRAQMFLLTVGAIALLIAFSFDGHTVSNGNRIIASMSSVVHVGAGAVWVGGVVGLLVLLSGRANPRGLPGAAELVVRFSVIASAALLVVAVFGVVLGVVMVNELSEFWSTQWGRTLIAKTVLVVIAACIGAFNRFRVLPRLEQGGSALVLRRALRVETAVLLGVLLLSALLMGANL